MKLRLILAVCLLSYVVNVSALLLVEWHWWLPLVALLAWYAADAQSGIIHMYMDYRPCTPNVGLKDVFFYKGSRASPEYQQLFKQTMRRISFFERVVYDFKNHHPRPNALGRRTFEVQTLSISVFLLPFSIAANVAFFYFHLSDWLTVFLVFFLTGSLLTQYFHGTLHRGNNPRLIGWLRRSRLLMTPKQHELHHATLDRDFATINGWSNPLVNHIFNFFHQRGKLSRSGLEPE